MSFSALVMSVLGALVMSVLGVVLVSGGTLVVVMAARAAGEVFMMVAVLLVFVLWRDDGEVVRCGGNVVVCCASCGNWYGVVLGDDVDDEVPSSDWMLVRRGMEVRARLLCK